MHTNNEDNHTKKSTTQSLLSSKIVDSNEETISEYSLRPSLFDEFIGQEHIKSNLLVFIQSAKNRGEALDHTLFYGPPGLGKTSLAHIISKEMKVNFKSTSGPALSKVADIAAILTNLGENDILFIDEIHRLNINIEEVLYPAMEDFSIDIIIGEGPAARAIKIDIPRFTLIGATTRIGLLSNPMRDRFGIPLRLKFYEIGELVKILNRAAKILQIDITHDGAIEISKRSRGTPRIALRLLKRVRDFAIVNNNTQINDKSADYALNRLEVDALGLDSNDYRYLKFIAEKYDGGPVGIETIAVALSEQRDSIEDTIEPYLIQIGLLERSSRGRIITDIAFKHIGLNKKMTNLPKNHLLF